MLNAYQILNRSMFQKATGMKTQRTNSQTDPEKDKQIRNQV